MRGPIDYIIAGFEGNKFDGSILKALAEAIDKGVVGLISLSTIVRDDNDNIKLLDISDYEDKYVAEFIQKYKPARSEVDQSDLTEVGDLINKKCTALFLVIEQLWAKPLKKAMLDVNGVLLAEGRIHPEAANELN